MNRVIIFEKIRKVSDRLYKNNKELSQLCEEIVDWELDNTSMITPRYKEPFLSILSKYESKCKDIMNDHK